MGRRQVEVEQLVHLVPTLLQSIKDQSGVSYGEIYRRLGEVMGLAPESVKRNWMRWRAVSDKVDERGRLPHSNTLKRFIRAASSLGWLEGADSSKCAPLLSLLQRKDAIALEELERSMRRRAEQLRLQVRVLIHERRLTHFDDVTWLSAVLEAVGEEIALELRNRLLHGLKASDQTPTWLADDLLTGAVSRKIRSVREAGSRPLEVLEAEADGRESKELADFQRLQEESED